jgi:thiol-disulfide isomerase/thioredoxin
MIQRYSRVLTAIGIISASIALVAYQLAQFATDTSLNHWYSGADGYQAAVEQQKKNGKAIALFFHTDWCASCKNLRETVLSTQQFDGFIQDLIPVKINPEQGINERKIADSYRVIGYPTFLIVTDNFKSVTPIRTGLNMAPEKFIASCKKALNT